MSDAASEALGERMLTAVKHYVEREVAKSEALWAGRLAALLSDFELRLVQAKAQPGKDGLNGKDGVDGKDGLNGKDGASGVDGVNGKDGVDGGLGRDGVDGKDGLHGKDGADGLHGKDGADGLHGKDGADGVDGTNGANGIDGVNGNSGVNGKDGEPGRDGVDGKDGVNGINGHDGRDGVNGVNGINGQDGAAGLSGEPGREGKDGRDGRDGTDGIGLDGRDALDIDILPELDQAKRYQRGTYARHKGGVVKTNGSGYDVVLNGVDGVAVEVVSERDFTVTTRTTDGTEHVTPVKLPVVVYRGIWKDGVRYERGDMVTRDGSTWHCEVEAPSEAPGGASADWKLCAKRGNHGKDGEPGKKGEPGPPGKPGRD